MKYIRLLTSIVFIIACVVFVGGKIYSSKKDTVAPVITSENDEIHVTAGLSTLELLRGLVATDDKDGDLTDKIIIRRISPFLEKGVSRVEYVVFDSSNNVGRYERTVCFDNYSSPQFALSKPLMYKENSGIIFSDRLTAMDVLEGDISKLIKFEFSDIQQNKAGTYYVAVSVKNEFGDFVEINIPVNIVENSDYGNRLQLSTYLIYVKAGNTVDPLSFVKKVVDVHGMDADRTEVQATYEVDMTVPGCGQIRYVYVDESGNRAVTFLTVIVTE